MEKEKKFPTTPKGCKEAQEYLKKVGAWNSSLERLDGYSQVHYANEIHNQPKSKKL